MVTNTQQAEQSAPVFRVPTNPRTPIIFGIATLLVAFGGFGSWAAIAPIASAVIASGVVTVDSNRKKIQHLEGGAVKELLVRDGDRVRSGDVLIRLDETRPKASLAILQSKFQRARAVEARLLAERDGSEQIIFPVELQNPSVEDRNSEILGGQIRVFEARKISLKGEISILQNRIAQFNDNIKGIRAQQRAQEQQISLIGEELEALRELLIKGFTDRPRILALEREAAELRGERGEHVSNIAQAKTRIGEARLQIIQLQSDLQEQVVTELREVRTELADLEERLGAAKHVLDHIEIRAPVDGIVVGMQAHTTGGVVGAGETILEIVPADDPLIVEVQVKPVDIDNITLGQTAEVEFPAFKQRATPTILGRVVYVSADRLIDSRSGESYFQARIIIPEEQVELLGEQHLFPGMPAQAMIRTGERTALQYWIQPVVDSMQQAWREE